MRSFSDRSTHFEIVRSQTPVSVDGFALHEPTGEVRCCSCNEQALNVDEIPHKKDCPQRFVKSHWWAKHLANDE